MTATLQFPSAIALERLDQLVELFLEFLGGESSAGRCRPRTVDYYRRELDHWRAVLPPGIRLAELRAFHLIGKGGHRRHRVQAVQRLFNWAVDDMEVIERNPFAKVKLPPAGERSRVLTRPEAARLLRSLNPRAGWVLVAMAHTLARPGEIRLLRWRDYRDEPADPAAGRDAVHQFEFEFLEAADGDRIEFKGRRRRKDGVKRRIILIDRFMQMKLSRWRARRNPSPDDFIFTNNAGKQWTKDALALAVRRARKRAKLNGRDGEQIVAYTLRHTSATLATVNGVQDRILATMMGHASTRTTQRYQHVDPSMLVGKADQATAKPKIYRPPSLRKRKADDGPNLFSELEGGSE